MSVAHAYRIEASAHEAAIRYKRRIHISNFLVAERAQSLWKSLEALPRWNTVTRAGDRHLDLDAAGLETLTPADQIRFQEAVSDQARRGFQYLFDNYPVYDAYYSGRIVSDDLKALFEFLNCEAVLDFVREVTGIDDIAYADAQATRYRAGHFLTEHDDDVAGKNRCAAFVLNLTPDWKADWGGLLMFIGEDGHVEEAYTPKFNALNLFTVPQRHCVSMVTPFAARPRYSVTGWFRAGEDPLRAQKSPANER